MTSANNSIQEPTSSMETQDQLMASCIYTLKRSRNLWPVINILGLITWIFSMVGTFHCSFIMIEKTLSLGPRPTANDTASEQEELVDHPVGLGLFSTSVYDMDANLLGCVSYFGTSDEFDGAFRAARTFGMIAALCTSVALVCVTLVTLFVESPRLKVNLWSVGRFLFFAAFLSELLTFLGFGRELCNRNDMECRPGAASILTVLNLFLLCGLSALIYVVPPVQSPLFFRRKGSSSLRGSDDQQSSAKFEILSVPASSISSIRSQQRQRPADTDGLDLESERGKDETPIIMEGIECVAADHLERRDQLSYWDKIVERYYDFGSKKSTRITIAILLCISWIFTIKGTTRCTFILVGASGQDRNEFSGLGLFNRAYYMNDDILGCIAYPHDARKEFDAAFQVGRAFGIMTFMLVTAAFVSFFVLHGFLESAGNREMAWWITQLALPCAFVTQMITFSAFKTQSCTQSNNVDCVPGISAIFAILNVLVLLPLAIFIFSLPCPERSLFRMRIPPSTRRPSSPTIKNQVREMKEHTKQPDQKQNNSQAGGQDIDEGPSSTHSVSDHSHDDYVVQVRSYAAPDPPAAVDESIEVCNTTTVDEQNGTRTTTKEIHHPDGSTTITTTVERCEYEFDDIAAKSTSSHRSSACSQENVMEPTSTSGGMPSTSTSGGMPSTSTEPTSTSGGMPGTSTSGGMPSTFTSGMPSTSTSGGPTITQTSSWDSGVSMEQFETVDMDNSNSSHHRANVIERNILRAAATREQESVRTPQDAQCCLVEATAMSIIKEMQEQEEQKRLRERQYLQKQQSSKSKQKPDPAPSFIPNSNFRQDVLPPMNDPDHSTLTSSSRPSDTLTSSSRPSDTTTTTPRGGRLNPGTVDSSDAVGEPTSSSGDTTYSKVSSTEYCFGSDDDGITFNTGDAIDTGDSVAVQVEDRPQRKRSTQKVFV